MPWTGHGSGRVLWQEATTSVERGAWVGTSLKPIMQQRGEFGSYKVELRRIVVLGVLICEAEAEAHSFPAREMKFCLGEVLEPFFVRGADSVNCHSCLGYAQNAAGRTTAFRKHSDHWKNQAGKAEKKEEKDRA